MPANINRRTDTRREIDHGNSNCVQSETIVRLDTTLGQIVALMGKHEEREERMIEAMERVAAQTEIIHAHAESLARHDRDIDRSFTELRLNAEVSRKELKEAENSLKLEINATAEELRRKKNFAITALESEAGNYIAVGVTLLLLLAISVDIVAHFPIVMRILQVFQTVKP